MRPTSCRVLLVWCLISSSMPSALARDFDEDVYDAVVRVESSLGSGTGVVIARSSQKTLILTARHVLGDAPFANVYFSGNLFSPIQAKRLVGEVKPDLAVLQVTESRNIPPQVRWLNLANEALVQPGPVSVIGFPRREQRAAVASAFLAEDRVTLKSAVCKSPECLQKGYSGGPVLSGDRVIGLHSAFDFATNKGLLVPVSDIISFLDRKDLAKELGAHETYPIESDEQRSYLEIANNLITQSRAARQRDDLQLSLLMLAQARAFGIRSTFWSAIAQRYFDELAMITSQPYLRQKVLSPETQVLGVTSLPDGATALVKRSDSAFSLRRYRVAADGIVDSAEFSLDEKPLFFNPTRIVAIAGQASFLLLGDHTDAIKCEFGNFRLICRSLPKLPLEGRSVEAAVELRGTISILPTGADREFSLGPHQDSWSWSKPFLISSSWQETNLEQQRCLDHHHILSRYTADGRNIVLVNGSGVIIVYDRLSKKLVSINPTKYSDCQGKFLHSNDVFDVGISTNGAEVALTFRDAEILVVQFSQGFSTTPSIKTIRPACEASDSSGFLLFCEDRLPAQTLALSPDGQRLAIGTGSIPGRVMIFDVNTPNRAIVDESGAHTASIETVVFIGQSKSLLSLADRSPGHGDESHSALTLWTPFDRGRVLRARDDVGRNVKFDERGKILLVSGFSYGVADLFYVETSKQFSEVASSSDNLQRPFFSASFVYGSNAVIGGSMNGKATLWQIEQADSSISKLVQRATVDVSDRPLAASVFVSSTSSVLFCDEDGHIYELKPDLVQMRLAPAQSRGATNRRCEALDATADGAIIVVGGSSGAILLSRSANSEEYKGLEMDTSTAGQVTALAIGKKGRAQGYLAIGNSGGYVTIFDVLNSDVLTQKTISPKVTIPASGSAVTRVAFGGSNALAVSGQDGVVSLFEFDPRESTILTHQYRGDDPTGIGALDLSQDGDFLAVVGKWSSIVNVWPVVDTIALPCKLIQENFSLDQWRTVVSHEAIPYERTCQRLQSGPGGGINAPPALSSQ